MKYLSTPFSLVEIYNDLIILEHDGESSYMVEVGIVSIGVSCLQGLVVRALPRFCQLRSALKMWACTSCRAHAEYLRNGRQGFTDLSGRIICCRCLPEGLWLSTLETIDGAHWYPLGIEVNHSRYRPKGFRPSTLKAVNEIHWYFPSIGVNHYQYTPKIFWSSALGIVSRAR